MNGCNCFRKSIDRFFRSYVRKKGYKDGFLGFAVSLNSGLYQIFSYLKYLEIIRNEKDPKS